MTTLEVERDLEEAVAQQRATVILCAWRNLLAETAECMLQLRDKGWGYVIKRGDALITRSRSIAVSDWYTKTDEDVFLMIDDDVVFESLGAEKVVAQARKTRSIACAAYPVKDGTHLACRRFPGQEIVFGPESPPVEIIYAATGFMAVHRDVITAMIEAKGPDGELLFPKCTVGAQMWPIFDTFAYRHDTGAYEYLSEDYAFSENARRLGFRIWLDPSVTLFHMGFYPYNVHNMTVGMKPLEAPEDDTVITTDGFRLHLPLGDEVIADDLKMQGAWDIETRQGLVEVLRPEDTFLDLGAHIGYFSLVASSRCREVIAVEPMPQNFDLLRKNIELNEARNIEAIPVAVDIAEGLATMVMTRRNTGDARLVRDGMMAVGERASVAVRTLPQVLTGRWPDVIKIDIEGADMRVLRNNPAILDRARAVIFEVNDRLLDSESQESRDDMLLLFLNAGFKLRKLIERGTYEDWLAVRE